MYSSPWKNFALYRKFGKFENTIQAASQHPILFRYSNNTISGCFAYLTLSILYTLFSLLFLFSLFYNFTYIYCFWDGGWVSKNSEAELWFGGLFIASSLYTVRIRGFFNVYFVNFLPSMYTSRIFSCVFKQATWLLFITLWNYQSVWLPDPKSSLYSTDPCIRGGSHDTRHLQLFAPSG